MLSTYTIYVELLNNFWKFIKVMKINPGHEQPTVIKDQNYYVY